MVPGAGIQGQLQPAQAAEDDDEARGLAGQRARRAGRQRDAQEHRGQERRAVRGIFGLVPVGVEGEHHPQPPDRGEQHDEAAQVAQARVLLERAGELADRPGERQVQEELNPASASLLAVVTVRRP